MYELQREAIPISQKLLRMKNGVSTELLTAKQIAKQKTPKQATAASPIEGFRVATTHKQKRTAPICVNRRSSVPPDRKAWRSFMTESVGPCVIGPNIELFGKHNWTTPNGIVHIEPGAQFRIQVASFGGDETLLPKGMI